MQLEKDQLRTWLQGTQFQSVIQCLRERKSVFQRKNKSKLWFEFQYVMTVPQMVAQRGFFLSNAKAYKKSKTETKQLLQVNNNQKAPFVHHFNK